MSNSSMLSSTVLMMDICVLPNLVIINKIPVYICECEEVLCGQMFLFLLNSFRFLAVILLGHMVSGW